MRRPTGEQPVVQRNGLGSQTRALTHSLTHSPGRGRNKVGRRRDERKRGEKRTCMHRAEGRTDADGRSLPTATLDPRARAQAQTGCCLLGGWTRWQRRCPLWPHYVETANQPTTFVSRLSNRRASGGGASERACTGKRNQPTDRPTASERTIKGESRQRQQRPRRGGRERERERDKRQRPYFPNADGRGRSGLGGHDQESRLGAMRVHACYL